jgi:GNAT superfamily N-acetyltransferase
MPHTIEHAVPAAVEYCELRVAAGLSPMDEGAAADALPRSLFAVTVRDGGRLVGMGRLVGDGLHVQVVDIAVHPGHQGRGLGRQVMEHIMDFVHREIPECAVVSLLADIDWLYQKFGFDLPRRSVGMMLRRRPVPRQ